MAILRSRSSIEHIHSLEYPVVRESVAGWERRMDEARNDGIEIGRQRGLGEAEERIAAAERRAAEAEQKAADAERRAAEAEQKAADADQRAATADTRAEERLAERKAAMVADLELRYERAIASVIEATTHLDGLEKQLIREAEQDIARLALVIAARLLRRELDDDPTWLDPVIAEVLALVPDKRGVALRMHPQDAAVARERKRLLATESGVERLEIFDDDLLPRGSCVVASQGTRLDASIPSGWERLFRDLLDEPRPSLAINADGSEAAP